MEPGLFEMATFNATKANFPNGCHICEVEITPETGRIEILRYSVIDDCGVELNPLLVKGQVHGGIVQGAGQALMENIVYEAGSGQLLTGSFMDYAMPRADDFCAFEVSAYPVPTKTNPLGVKGVGESGTVGALASVMNAINDALAPLGVRHIEMPATPGRIWQAIQEAKSAA
jgi:carbon-monoxide dehydrogenase large subunit